MAKKIICPECKREVESNVTACPNCGFDIYLYVSEYKRIYDKKVAAYDGAKISGEPVQAQLNVPKCPTCGSTNIVKISGAERALNAAAFGLLGNRRKYHWHCNNCKYEW